jgi:phosphopantothenoylcysteine decarboxylase/phosphopantothenate--cysteine ligase
MREPDEIVAECARLLAPKSRLRGRRVVVTAGPTREPLDPVRFISNRSSGKMGVAIARAALRRGAEVTFIAGAITVPAPHGAATVHVERTAEMKDEVVKVLPSADVLIMAAAPADFRPVKVAESKIKKRGALEPITLTMNDDILKSTISIRKPGAVIVGFALETDDLIANAKSKLDAKSLDMVVANDARQHDGAFGADTNRVTILRHGKEPEALARMTKDAVADAILDRVETLLKGSP